MRSLVLLFQDKLAYAECSDLIVMSVCSYTIIYDSWRVVM